MTKVSDFLRTNDHQLWLLIGVSVAMMLTLEAVEEAVEGAWPHQRRAAGMARSERIAHPFWGIVAALVLPGALLEVGILAVMAWKHVNRPETLVVGSIMLGIGWVLFMLASIDRLRLRRLMVAAGAAAPLALAVVLLVADFLLLVAFTDIRPSVDSVRDAIKSLI
jgi:hypothetical protein